MKSMNLGLRLNANELADLVKAIDRAQPLPEPHLSLFYKIFTVCKYKIYVQPLECYTEHFSAAQASDKLFISWIWTKNKRQLQRNILHELSHAHLRATKGKIGHRVPWQLDFIHRSFLWFTHTRDIKLLGMCLINALRYSLRTAGYNGF